LSVRLLAGGRSWRRMRWTQGMSWAPSMCSRAEVETFSRLSGQPALSTSRWAPDDHSPWPGGRLSRMTEQQTSCGHQEADAHHTQLKTLVGRQINVFAALDNGFKFSGTRPLEIGEVLTAYLSRMPVVPFAEPFLNAPDLFSEVVPRHAAPDSRAWWLPTPIGAVYTTVLERAQSPQVHSLHVVSPDVVQTPVPTGCFPFNMRLDRARDVYCEMRPTFGYFEWVVGGERFVDTGDFRPTDFTMGRFPPPFEPAGCGPLERHVAGAGAAIGASSARLIRGPSPRPTPDSCRPRVPHNIRIFCRPRP
jgi:hypothetical protein